MGRSLQFTCTLSQEPAECWQHPQIPGSGLGHLQAVHAACGECIECSLDASDLQCTRGGGGSCVVRKLHVFWTHQISCTVPFPVAHCLQPHFWTSLHCAISQSIPTAPCPENSQLGKPTALPELQITSCTLRPVFKNPRDLSYSCNRSIY